MSSSYPGSLDNFSTSHADGVNETIHASTINDLADAVNKIESTLGANPVLTSNFSKVRTVTSSSTAASTDYQVLGDATSANITVTLPAASSSSGQRLLVRKIDSSTHIVTVAPAGSDTIDGNTGSVVLRSQYEQLEVVSDGTGWQRVGSIQGNQAVYYVDATYGNDSWDGHWPWRPKKTISAAIGNNRTIYVAAGTYSETVTMSATNSCRLMGESMNSTIIQAPSDTVSALVCTSNMVNCEIGNLALYGHSDTYTGTVLSSSGISNPNYFHDLVISGIGVDGGAGNKTRQFVCTGVYGGTGLLIQDQEQVTYERIFLQGCHLGIDVYSNTTISQIRLRDISFNRMYNCFRERQGAQGGGENYYSSWKTQQNYSMAYAGAQLQSDNTNPADGDTVTINGTTYRFKNTMALANDVQIGVDANTSLTNLMDAINGTGTAGTNWFAGTTALAPNFSAGWFNTGPQGGSNGYTNGAIDTTNHRMGVRTETLLGQAGNAVTVSESSAHLSWVGFDNTTVITTFANGDYGMWFMWTGVHDSLSGLEQISGGSANLILIDAAPTSPPPQNGSGSLWRGCGNAPQTVLLVKGSNNWFDGWFCNGGKIYVTGSQNTFRNPRGSNQFNDQGTNNRWIDVPTQSNPANNIVDLSSAIAPKGSYSPPVPTKSGLYYATPAQSPITTFVPTLNRVYFLPVWAPETGLSFSDVAIRVTTGAASALAYVGLYKPDSRNLPGNWQGNGFTSNALSAASSGTTLSFGSITNGNLQGMWYLAVGFRVAAPTVAGIASGTAPGWLVGSATLTDISGGGGQCYYQDSILSGTGPYFSNATAPVAGSGAPAIFYQFN